MKVVKIYIFCLVLLLSACAKQEPAPVEFGSPLSSSYTPNPRASEEKIVKRSFDTSIQNDDKDNDKNDEKKEYLKEKHSLKEKKYVSDDEEDKVKKITPIKQKENDEKVEEDFESELKSIEEKDVKKEEKPKKEKIPETKKEEVVVKDEKQEEKQEEKILPEATPDISLPKFIMPSNGKIINMFGDLVDGAKLSGVNIKGELSEPVVAIADGVVSQVSKEGKFGNRVIIKHSAGEFQSAYAYLDTVTISKGQIIHQGDEIGTIGKTGEAKEPMLHFALREGQKAVDPLKYIK